MGNKQRKPRNRQRKHWAANLTAAAGLLTCAATISTLATAGLPAALWTFGAGATAIAISWGTGKHYDT